MPIGNVRTVHESEGYGFIHTEASEEHVYFMVEDADDPGITVGARVRFLIVHGEKGPQASQIQRL